MVVSKSALIENKIFIQIDEMNDIFLSYDKH